MAAVRRLNKPKLTTCSINRFSRHIANYCVRYRKFSDVTKHRTSAKYRSWVLVKCVWCGAYYWFRLRKGTGYGFHAFLTCILLLLLLIQCKISLYLRPVRCFVTLWIGWIFTADIIFGSVRFPKHCICTVLYLWRPANYNHPKVLESFRIKPVIEQSI